MPLKMIERAWENIEYRANLSGDKRRMRAAHQHLLRLEQMYCHKFYGDPK